MKNRARHRRARAAARVSFCLLLGVAAGCMSSNVSAPEDTAVEQLLLSTAADRAVAGIELEACRGKTVFVDGQYLDTYRTNYLIAILRAELAAAGARLAAKAEDADLVLEPRSAALSIDGSESLLGLPQISVGAPLTGGVSLPEAPLYKKITQRAIGKLALIGRFRGEEQPSLYLGPSVGRAYYNRWWLLFLISFRTTDIEEK